MKKKFLLFTAFAGMSMLVLTSGQNGAGFESHYNATGSETGLGNINGCKASGCHGTTATTGITVTLELDSAGVAQHYYTPGITYTVMIKGTNTTTNTLPDFGFQVSCIKGTAAATTPVNAGTFATTGLPAGVRYTASIPADFVCNMIEHSSPIAATTGSGGTGTTYVESFQWTAPAAGTGTISFWGALNAVNFDHGVGGDFWNTTELIISEGKRSLNTAITENNSLSLHVFPNPATTELHIEIGDAQPGTYNLHIFNMNGSTIDSRSIEVAGMSQSTLISTANWTPGLYHVVIENNGVRTNQMIVKQ